MPHANPKVDKFERDTMAHIKAHGKKGKKGKKGAKLDRDVVEAAARKFIANLREIADDPTSLKEGIDHVEANIPAILDGIEAES